MFRRALLALAVLALPLAAGADTLYTMKSHTDAFKMGGQSQPAKDETVKVWVSGDRLRRDEGEQSMILRMDKNRLYVVDHEDKTLHAATPTWIGSVSENVDPLPRRLDTERCA